MSIGLFIFPPIIYSFSSHFLFLDASMVWSPECFETHYEIQIIVPNFVSYSSRILLICYWMARI